MNSEVFQPPLCLSLFHPLFFKWTHYCFTVLNLFTTPIIIECVYMCVLRLLTCDCSIEPKYPTRHVVDAIRKSMVSIWRRDGVDPNVVGTQLWS